MELVFVVFMRTTEQTLLRTLVPGWWACRALRFRGGVHGDGGVRGGEVDVAVAGISLDVGLEGGARAVALVAGVVEPLELDLAILDSSGFDPAGLGGAGASQVAAKLLGGSGMELIATDSTSDGAGTRGGRIDRPCNGAEEGPWSSAPSCTVQLLDLSQPLRELVTGVQATLRVGHELLEEL